MLTVSKTSVPMKTTADWQNFVKSLIVWNDPTKMLWKILLRGFPVDLSYSAFMRSAAASAHAVAATDCAAGKRTAKKAHITD